MAISWKKYHLSTKFKTNCLALVKKLRALSLMGFFHFLSVLLCSPAVLAIYCENLPMHWFAIMAVSISHPKILRFFLVHSNKFGFSHQQTLSFSGSLILRISFTWKTQGLLIREAKFLFRSPKKLKIFLFEMQTAIIAHQWKSKFSQCTANPAGLQRKTDRKMEKPIALRARSFFPWAKLLVLNFVERKNHLSLEIGSKNWVF